MHTNKPVFLERSVHRRYFLFYLAADFFFYSTLLLMMLRLLCTSLIFLLLLLLLLLLSFYFVHKFKHDAYFVLKLVHAYVTCESAFVSMRYCGNERFFKQQVVVDRIIYKYILLLFFLPENKRTNE